MSILVASLLLQTLSVSAGDRTEVRVRNGGTAAQASSQVDALTQGRFALQLQKSRASWEVAYSPLWTALSISSPSGSTALVHNGSLVGQLRLSRTTNLSLAESASYGQQNFRLLSISTPSSADAGATAGAAASSSSGGVSGSPPTAQSPVADRSIHYATLTTGATLTHRLSRQWGESTTVGYSVSGGVDEASRLAYPQMKVLQGREAVSDRVSRHDTLSLTLGGTTSTMPVMTYYAASLEAGWSRTISANTTTTLSAGSTYWVSLPAAGEERRGILPTGSGTIAHSTSVGHGRLSLSLRESMMPIVDRLLGTVYPQSSTSVTISYTQGKVAISGAAATAVNFGGAQRSSRYNGSASESISYRLAEPLMVEAGTRQGLLGLGESGPAIFMWTTYVALTIASGPQRI